MEKELIAFEKEFFIDSRIIAEKFGRSHKNVLQKIDSLKKKENSSFKESTRIFRGREFRYVKMNLQGCLLLITSFTGEKHIKGKAELFKIIANAFKNFSQIIKALNNFDTDDIPVRFIYAAMDERGRIKIGISNNPERRVKELNTGNADELKLIFVKQTKNKGFLDETKLHKQGKEYHIRSEWFNNDVYQLLQKGE